MPRTRGRALSAVLVVLGSLLGAGLTGPPAAADTPALRRLPGVQVPLMQGSARLTDLQRSQGRAMLRSSTQAALVAANPASEWIVHYDDGFTTHPDAQAAFQAAVDIWAGIVRSTVPIRVDASFTSLGPGVLGSAGPKNIELLTVGGKDRYYPSALADAITATDIEGDLVPDITARFNKDQSAFYFGTDGQLGLDQYDFESVVLHELGHGLGFVGSAGYDAATSTGNFDVGSDGTVFDPFGFDGFESDGTGAALLDLANPSVLLGTALTSGQVFWNGANGITANASTRPQLYAPNPWQGGSSISHLDEASYPAGNASSLMTPYLFNGEAIHSPGVVTVGIFKDLGWDATLSAPGVPTAVTAETDVSSATVSWAAPPANGSPITGYTVLVHQGATTTAVASAGTGTSKAVTGLSENTDYTFGVTATNALGTSAESAPSALVTTGPDTTPPAVSISSPVASGITKGSGTISFSGSDPGHAAVPTFACTLDGASTGCSPFTFSGLADGVSHTAVVTATDAATPPNQGQATVTWTVDAVAPAVTITGKPPLLTNVTSATLGATVTDAHPGTTICKVDGVAKTCGMTVTGLSQAQHTFSVTATDAAGNATPGSYSWRVDTTKPTVTSSTMTPYSLATSVVFAFSGTDSGGAGLQDYSARYRRAPWNGTFPTTYSALATSTATSRTVAVAKGYTYCFSAQSRDKAGNLSAWSTERCTGIALDDMALTASRGWTRGSSSAFYASTYVTAVTPAVTLTRTSVQARKVYLVASVCKGCGSVTASWNGTVLRTISLSTTSTTPSYKKVFLVTDFGAVRSGTLVLKTTSGARVYVDGVAFNRY